MRVHFKALADYTEGNVTSRALVANKVELIQMLFDGLIDAICAARGHMQRKAIEPKCQAIGRASRIVIGLKSALDTERGGELARNLSELYDYVLRRLMHANVHNDLEALQEVQGLMGEIQQAWRAVPALVPAAPASNATPALASVAVH